MQNTLVITEVLKALQNAFPSVALIETVDNGYEERRIEINCENYSLERDGSDWNWSCGNETDNKLHSSYVECLQAAMDYASEKEAAAHEAWKSDPHNDCFCERGE